MAASRSIRSRPSVRKAPARRSADRAGGVAARRGRARPASSRPRPGGAPRRSASARSSRASSPSARGDDRERRRRPGERHVVALQQVGARRRPRRSCAGTRVQRDDLRVLAGGHQRLQVGVAPRPQRRLAVDQRLARQADRWPTPASRLAIRASRRAARSAATSAPGGPARQPALGLAPAAERAQPALAVLGGEVGQRVHAAAVQPPRRQVEPVAVALQRVDQLVDAGRRGRPRRRPATAVSVEPSERSAARRSARARGRPPARGRPW